MCVVSETANDMVKPQQDEGVAGVFKEWERSGEAVGAWSRRCPRESWLLLIDLEQQRGWPEVGGSGRGGLVGVCLHKVT